tara:strand:+ start:132 stop:434 length:303 start_codon:yes stop_codon:yes gene_type:complete
LIDTNGRLRFDGACYPFWNVPATFQIWQNLAIAFFFYFSTTYKCLLLLSFRLKSNQFYFGIYGFYYLMDFVILWILLLGKKIEMKINQYVDSHNQNKNTK